VGHIIGRHDEGYFAPINRFYEKKMTFALTFTLKICPQPEGDRLGEGERKYKRQGETLALE
jgi:hypothetical protein